MISRTRGEIFKYWYLVWFSLCNLGVLCASVVIGMHDTTTTETQRTPRLHREGHHRLPAWLVRQNVSTDLIESAEFSGIALFEVAALPDHVGGVLAPHS